MEAHIILIENFWNKILGLERKTNLKDSCTSEREINPRERKIPSLFPWKEDFRWVFKMCFFSL